MPPAHFWAPPFETTLGPEVADLAAMAGFVADPEQRLILDTMFARGADKRIAAFMVSLVCARQNLKTGALKMAALGWLYITGEELVVWSAHEFGTAQEAFRDMCILIESCPDLDREVKQVHRGNGDEAIELTENRRLKFKARTKSGGRGLTGNKVVLDEAMYLQGAHMGSLLPTLSAVRDAQVILAGSAGFSTSLVQHDTRDRGRAGDDLGLAYIEWCAPEGGCASKDCDHRKDAVGCAADDPENWQRANPAMGRRITRDYIAVERRSLPPKEFVRERLGWWEATAAGGLFHMPDWYAVQDEDSLPGARVCYGVHVTPDRNHAAVAVASLRGDGTLHVEVAEHKDGVSWLQPWLVGARDRVPDLTVAGVVLAGSMAAGTLLVDLEHQVPGLVSLNATDVRRSCAAFYDAVSARTLAVLPDFDLDSAVTHASRSSQRGEWVFDAPPDVDLSPLYAAALAAWAVRSETGSEVSVFFFSDLDKDDPDPDGDGVDAQDSDEPPYGVVERSFFT